MAANVADTEIRAVLDGMIEALNAGDRDRLRTFLSQQGGTHIGSDGTEWFTNDELLGSLGGGDATGIQIVVEEWEIHGGNGEFAWVAGRAHFEDESKQSPAVRLSVVLAREGDHWVAVHSHASLGVANAEMFG